MKKSDITGNNELKRKRVKVGSWFSPLEKVELDRIAQVEGLSLSQIVRAYVVEGMRRKLHEQQDDFLFPKLRQLLREDREASDNRSRHFSIETAFAAEQSRILITNVLDCVLRLTIMGPNADKIAAKTSDDIAAKTLEDIITKTREDIVSRSSDTARRNIMNRFILPVQAMFAKWKQGMWGTGLNGKEHTL